MLKRKMPLVHPGIIFLREVLEPLNLTIDHAAQQMNIDPNELAQICKGQTPITQVIAEKIAAVYDGTADIWVNMQHSYDHDEVRLNQPSNDI